MKKSLLLTLILSIIIFFEIDSNAYTIINVSDYGNFSNSDMNYSFISNETLSEPSLNTKYLVSASTPYGCTGTPPTPNITYNPSTTELTCHTPSITLMASGGSTYSWLNGPSTAEYVVSTPGTYEVTVTGTNGCSSSASVNITANMALPNVVITNNTGSTILDCNNSIISVVANGGVSYSWSNGSMNANNSFITAGTYVVTATSSNGCTNSASITITQAAPLTVSITANPILCFGETTTVNILASGGTTPYHGGGAITNISAGTYQYTVTDANGCTASNFIEITQPEEIDIQFIDIQAVSCYGMADGMATARVTGGVGTYLYRWDDPANTSTPEITDLTAGYWKLQITDDNNCIASDSIEITEPEQLILDLLVQHVPCFGDETGTIDIGNTAGGTVPYTFTINGDTVNLPYDAQPGRYEVKISDSNNCKDSTVLNILEHTAINMQLEPTMVTCGVNSGSIIATVTGGNFPYSFAWSNNEITKDLENLPVGLYTLTVTDANGCSSYKTTNISALNNLNINISELSISCAGGSTGILNMNSNGYGELDIIWNNGENTPTIENLKAGIYTVTVNDEWGCTGSKNYSLAEPNEIVVGSVINNVKCHGENSGSISLSINGGVEPYNVAWNIAKTGYEVTNLAEGTYTATVSDFNNCSKTLEFTVAEPDSLEFIYEIKDVSCASNSDGAVILNGLGGTKPYKYSVAKSSNGFPQTNYNALKADKYIISIEDGKKCKASKEITINEPQKLEFSYSYSDPSCIKNSDGHIEVNAYGGTLPYTYKVNNALHNGNKIIGLKEGIYNIEVIDSNLCSYTVKKIILTDTEINCLIIPNAFTPNGDGINDTWIIEGIEKFPDASISVFNKWGQELYNGKGSDAPWDGKYKSDKIPAGTYIYTIKHFDGELLYGGTLSILY